MKKHLAILLTLAMIFSVIALPGAAEANSLTGIILSGVSDAKSVSDLATVTTSKEANGAKLNFFISANGGSVVNSDGGMILTPNGGWSELDAILKLPANNSSHNGIITYEWLFETNTSKPMRMYMRYGKEDEHFNGGTTVTELQDNSDFSTNSSYKLGFVYNTTTGALSTTVNGTTKSTVTLDKETGVDELFIRYMSTTKGEYVTLKDVCITYSEIVTGYGTYLSGLPYMGTSKTENGASLSFSIANGGSVENMGGYIKMTPPGGWNQVDAVLEFPANSSLDGLVTYEWLFETTASVPKAVYMKYGDGNGTEIIQLTSSEFAANTQYLLGIAYNTKSGELYTTVNGVKKNTIEISDLAAGVSRVFIRYLSEADSGGYALLKNVSVTYSQIKTGYGTYLEGLPAVGLSKIENGASFYQSGSGTSANTGSGITMSTNGWSSDVVSTLDFKADNTLNGIVTYEYTISMDANPNSIYLRPNNDKPNYNFSMVSNSSYIPIFENGDNPTGMSTTLPSDGTQFTIGFAYNTKTGDWCCTLNGYEATNPVYNTTLDGSTAKKLDPSTGISLVSLVTYTTATDKKVTLHNVKVSYYQFDDISYSGLITDGETAAASVEYYKAAYFSALDDAMLVIAKYNEDGTEVQSIDVAYVGDETGAGEISAFVEAAESDNVKAFFWSKDLVPLAQ